MQKYLKILERHVEWIALGLAALFLGYMVWGYVLHPPVTVKLTANKVVLPGEVCETIVKGPVGELQGDIARKNDSFAINVPDLVTHWETIVLNPAAPSYLRGIVPWDPRGGTGPIVKDPTSTTTIVQALPVLPAATPDAVSSVRTIVQFGSPKFIPPANDPQAKAPIVTANKDIDSIKFKIDMSKIWDSFNKALDKQPAELYKTMFLQTVLYREEQLPDGKWGNRVTVPPLAIHEMMDYPGDTVGMQKAIPYEEWALKHVDEILHPAFYEVAAGAKPYEEPGAQVTPVVNTPVQPAPMVPQPTMDPTRRPGLPNRPKVPAGAMPGMAPPVGGRHAPADPDRPGQAYPRPSPTGARPYNGGPAGYPGMPGPGMPGYGGYGRPMMPYMPQPGMRPQAPGMFNPGLGQQGGTYDLSTAQAPPDVTVVLHDDTAEPGKTYRYILQYRMKNSLYNSSVPVKDKKWHDQFALVSPESAPSAPVTIPERSELFVRSIKGTEVHFDVFTWDGQEKLKDVAAAPGDSVLPTNWIVSDIRTDPRSRELYVLLIDKNGRIQRRDYKTDQNDATYKQRQDEVKGATASAQ